MSKGSDLFLFSLVYSHLIIYLASKRNNPESLYQMSFKYHVLNDP